MRNSAVLSTDGFLRGKTVGITLCFTPIHLAVGISVPPFLALVVLPSARGGTAGTARGTRDIIIILSFMEARTKAKGNMLSLRPHGIGPSCWSNCAGKALVHQSC